MTQHISILRLSALGDVCNTVPLIHALKQSKPTSQISWIIGHNEYQLVKRLKGVDFITIDKSNIIKARKKIRSFYRRSPSDIQLMPQYALRASLIAQATHSPQRVGYDKIRSRDLQSIFINQRIEHQPHQHVVDAYLDFVKKIVPWNGKADFSMPEVEDTIIAKIHKLCGDDYIVIAPSASNPIRNWSLESTLKVIRFIRQILGIRIILAGSPALNEMQLCQQIEQSANVPLINLCGKTSLQELLALIKNARVVIAPDSGPAHIANACKTPIIGLYACSNPQRSGPYNQEFVINKYPQACEQFLSKSVEEVPFGTRINHADAMNLIQLDDVIPILTKATSL
ncbi:MAG: glycosyltransferase family 9 protein [bacterium]